MTPAQRAARLLAWMSAQITSNPPLAAECFRVAHELEAYESLRAAVRAAGTCRRCGGEIVNTTRGRKRTYCRVCRPAYAPVRAREMGEKFEGE